MSNINSQYTGHFVSQGRKRDMKSITTSDIASKMELNVTSDVEAAAERAAFLATAKRNASIMFAKYL